jgi:hypothetical protein
VRKELHNKMVNRTGRDAVRYLLIKGILKIRRAILGAIEL